MMRRQVQNDSSEVQHAAGIFVRPSVPVQETLLSALRANYRYDLSQRRSYTSSSRLLLSGGGEHPQEREPQLPGLSFGGEGSQDEQQVSMVTHHHQEQQSYDAQRERGRLLPSMSSPLLGLIMAGRELSLRDEEARSRIVLDEALQMALDMTAFVVADDDKDDDDTKDPAQP